MLRGEFRSGDGLVIPNNVTQAGARGILRRSMRPDLQSGALYLGLCNAVYDPAMQVTDLDEPSLGTNGYNRIPIAPSAGGWNDVGFVNGEAYVESVPLVWTPTGAGFTKQVTRLWLGTTVDADSEVWALSSAFQAVTLTSATLVNARTFVYRLYLR